jgi:IS30 family transposase
VIVGKKHGSAIGTLVERQTRMIRLLHLPTHDSRTLLASLVERMSDLPPSLLRSITWDQGTEMALHNEITDALGIPIYFCDAHSPWQRGSNENANGLLRQYFPKGTDLTVHGPKHLLAVEDEINRRPRLVLDDHAPADLFERLLTSPSQPPLRR